MTPANPTDAGSKAAGTNPTIPRAARRGRHLLSRRSAPAEPSPAGSGANGAARHDAGGAAPVREHGIDVEQLRQRRRGARRT